MPKFKKKKKIGVYSSDGYIDYQTYTTWRNKVIQYVNDNDPKKSYDLSHLFNMFELTNFDPVRFVELISFIEVNIERHPSDITIDINDGKTKSNPDNTQFEIGEDLSGAVSEQNDNCNNNINWNKWGAIGTILSVIIALIVYADQIMEFIKRIFTWCQHIFD